LSAIPEWLETLAGLEEWRIERLLRHAPAPIRRRLFEEWSWQAHRGQIEPGGDWHVWLMLAGRGFGKTRAGAEWVSARARELPGARIALVGATIEDVVKVMIEGESGLSAAARTGERPRWSPSRGIVTFQSGALGFVYSAERPEKLRGPQHHFAWCDELGKWPHASDCWNNLMLGLRLGEGPRTVVTTTPRPLPLLHALIADARTAVTGGRTTDNPHLPREYIERVTALYGGTRIGRQELDGKLIGEAEGALWTRAMIERCRIAAPYPAVQRIVIGVDPPASVQGTCGIVVAGVARDESAGKPRETAYVLADATVSGASPERWAEVVAETAARWNADRVIAEANQGGAMVESVLRAVERLLPLKLRHASEAKGKRAEPVAALFESGRAKFAGGFAELEDQLCGLMPAGGYEGPGRSPDRADAMVWAVSELMLGRKAVPRVMGL
jgi:phage terminase large subunit-like protein